MIKSICSICNKEIELWHKQQLKGINHFCSEECRKLYFTITKIPNTQCINCKKEFYLKPYRIKRNKTITCSVNCANEQRKLYSLNNLNHSTFKNKKDTTLFRNLDTKEKAYLLGWIASDGHVAEDHITLCLQETDKYIIEILWNILCPNREIHYIFKKAANETSQNQYGFSFSSKEIVKDICELLEITPGKKSNIVFFDFNKYSSEIQNAFIRGYFDGDGGIKSIETIKYPSCNITSNSFRMLEIIHSIYGGNLYSNKIEWNGNDCLDFLDKIYNDRSFPALPRKYNLYIDWCSWIPSFGGANNCGRELLFKWNRCKEGAQPPFKARASDSGWDLTLLEKIKEIGDVELYSTGIKITPDYGWYFDLVPRSSIIKTDYMLANSIGIIDRTYIGEILVPLRKMKTNAKPLELPGRYVQIIPRPIIHFEFTEVSELDLTQRLDKGFGSSGI